MATLYPLKFKPIIKERVWGGDQLSQLLNKPKTGEKPTGESWELSGVQGDVSVVANGYLKENDINELVETYLGEITGDAIYEKYGVEFPILIKYLDIQQGLSIQVHPDDETALSRHESYGKTELWYIVDAAPDAKIYLGFNRDTTPQELYDKCNNDTVDELLNVITPKKGDYVLITPGTIHAATGGILVAEIQTTSDVTYRVYDWGREHNPKTAREMHLDLAIDIIDYNKYDLSQYHNSGKQNSESEIINDCNYFKISLLNPGKMMRFESSTFESFIIYMVLEGEILIDSKESSLKVSKGETVLIPSATGEYTILKNSTDCQLLEITGKG